MIEDLRAQGVKQIDALFISHAHGDHYGGLSKVCKAFPVKWLYLPDPTELDKYQRTYGNSLRRQSKKVKNFRWYKQGDSAMIGEIKFRCLFDCKAKDLAEKDPHHYVNNMSPVNYFECGEFIWHTAGDMQKFFPGGRAYYRAVCFFLPGGRAPSSRAGLQQAAGCNAARVRHLHRFFHDRNCCHRYYYCTKKSVYTGWQ